VKSLKENHIPEGYLSSREVAELFNVHPESVNTYCRNGTLTGAKKLLIGKTNKWFIPKETIDNIIFQKDEYSKNFYSVNEFADVLGINRTTIFSKIAEGEIPIKENNILFNPAGIKTVIDKRNPIIKHLLNHKNKIDNGLFLSQENAAKHLEIPIHEVYVLRKQMLENDEFKFFNNVYISKEAIEKAYNSRTVDNNYLTLYEASEALQRPPKSLQHHCQNGNIPNAKKVRNMWHIPKDYIEHVVNLKQNYRTIDEFANQLELSRNTVYNKIQDGLLPKFVLIDNIWRISVNDISIYEENYDIFIRKPQPPRHTDYSKETLIKELNTRILEVEKPHLQEFSRMFKAYCREIISNSNANSNTLKGYVADFFTIYDKIISAFPNDFDEDTQNQVKEVLAETGTHPRLHLKFNPFLNYAFGKKDIIPDKKLIVSKVKKNEDEDKEIYSPEIYQAINLFVRDLDKRIPQCCKSALSANMWVYVSIHLTDVWRHSDIVEKIPTINLEQIGVFEHSWFKVNRMSLKQCQKIVNELYLKLRPEVTNKTRSPLTFLVEPTLIESLAHAVVISEIYRRKYNSTNLLHTFVSSSGNTTRVNNTHLKFFDKQPELKVFRNQKMNNSTMTYLHYSIIEQDTDGADVALSIPQITRSHEKPDTTRIYVTVTNKDGSVNRVSLNLLQRGNFGWLYNYLIISALEGTGAVQSLEERTKTIEEMREELAPSELEDWARYLNAQRVKKHSVINQLSKMTKDELVDLIRKIFKQEMPAKTKPGQCLNYPSCKYPELNNCFGCEYFIPQYYVLIEAAKEFKRLVKSMKKAKYEATFIRDKKLLMTIFAIIKEAKGIYKTEQVNGFISPADIKMGVEILQAKEFIE
jgi:predicted DNA-binding transcriptional regulator AlpA